MEQAYFLTVDWCSKGKRGIFCHKTGSAFRKDKSPHTEEEMGEILGAFYLILAPESRLYSEGELSDFTYFIPLEEYTNEFGVALRAE